MSNGTQRMTARELADLGGIAEAASAKAEKAAAEGKRTYDSPESYAAVNPLGGPAVIFDSMADRVRAGEDFYHVLADYGFQEAAKPVSGQDQSGRAVKTQPAQREARKRYVVGIDPGVKTGFAVWDREKKRFAAIETRDFWSVMLPLILGTENLLPDVMIRNTTAEIIIEVAHNAPTFRHLKAEGENAHTLSKIARNVGQVTREAQLIVSGLRACGYAVIEQRPLGKAKKAADDVKQFERLTGWTERTSQHARDAARLCFQR